MNRRSQLLCIHSTLLFILTVGGGFLVAGWVPPPSPTRSAPLVAASFHDHFHIRLAAAMFFFGSALFMLPAVAITAQLRRLETERAVLANLQMLAAAVGVLAIQIPGAIWLVVSYRTGTSPGIIVTLNDLAWFMLLGAVGPAVVQNVSIALCILGKGGKGRDVYPRWLGYANLWLATLLMPGVLIPFFKTGPFAWNGVLGFWVVATGFFTWVILMWVYTVKAINEEAP
jgi:hypothetical protein